jgi:hypothetical protein
METSAAMSLDGLDDVLATQFVVAWAGEGKSKPRRFGWWDTDLIDENGGGDLMARLAPRTHAWAALEAVREAARRVDATARGKHGDSDRLRTIFFLGFELDERLNDRLASHKRAGHPPRDVLPLPTSFTLGADFPRDKVVAHLAPQKPPAFETVPPIGRELKQSIPAAVGDMVRTLAGALVPPADDYPMPFWRTKR